MASISEATRLISMDFSTNGRSDCYFRILVNRHVKYITVKAGTLDAETLDDMPLDFENILPPLPYREDYWNSACITRNSYSSQLEATLASVELPRVETIWHPCMIDHLDIERTEYLTLLAQECKWKKDAADTSARMIAKMARFHWEIQYIEAETRIYRVLEGHGIAPRFLGHIHEAGRVIGLLLERVADGRNAEPADLEICRAALRRFHALGFVHGDCNKYNFIICPGERVWLIDFDKARACVDPAVMEAEIASLDAELAESTGRGGGLMPYDETEDEE